MADNTIAIPEAASQAMEQAAGTAVAAASQAMEQATAGAMAYIAQHRLCLDGQEFQAGETLHLADAAVIAALRALGAIKLPIELQDAAAAAEQAARHAAENADLKARIAELEAALTSKAATASGTKGGK